MISLAVLGMSMAHLFFHWYLDFASVVQVATIVTTMPILVVVVDRIINKSPVSAPKVISGIVGFIGLIPDHIFKDGKQMKKSPSNEKRLRETRWDQP